MNINIKMELFKENDLYVALCPELNVGSHGETMESAKGAFQEAVTAFFEECREMGTLEEVLEESGFFCEGEIWRAREPISEESMPLAI